MSAAVAGGALVVSRSGPALEVGAMDKRHTGSQQPYRLLALAIIYRATLDARRGDVDARRWLLSDPLAAYLCAAVDLDRAAVIRAVCASTAAVAVSDA